MPIPDIPQIEGLNHHQVLTLVHCRSYKQYCAMLADYLAGKCPFCDPLDPEKNRVIQENAIWRMWHNPFAFKHTRLHLIMATQEHHGPEERITWEHFAAAGELYFWAQEEFQFTGGGFAMRFGTPEHNAGTVLHLHAQIIVPDQTGAVQVTLAKEPEKLMEQIARMRVFEKLRMGAFLESLSPEERRLVMGRL